MTVKRRVASIEKKVIAPSQCAICAGNGWAGAVVVNRAGRPTARLFGCPECGYTCGVKAYGGGTRPGVIPEWLAAV